MNALPKFIFTFLGLTLSMCAPLHAGGLLLSPCVFFPEAPRPPSSHTPAYIFHSLVSFRVGQCPWIKIEIWSLICFSSLILFWFLVFCFLTEKLLPEGSYRSDGPSPCSRKWNKSNFHGEGNLRAIGESGRSKSHLCQDCVHTGDLQPPGEARRARVCEDRALTDSCTSDSDRPAKDRPGTGVARPPAEHRRAAAQPAASSTEECARGLACEVPHSQLCASLVLDTSPSQSLCPYNETPIQS